MWVLSSTSFDIFENYKPIELLYINVHTIDEPRKHGLIYSYKNVCTFFSRVLNFTILVIFSSSRVFKFAIIYIKLLRILKRLYPNDISEYGFVVHVYKNWIYVTFKTTYSSRNSRTICVNCKKRLQIQYITHQIQIGCTNKKII